MCRGRQRAGSADTRPPPGTAEECSHHRKLPQRPREASAWAHKEPMLPHTHLGPLASSENCESPQLVLLSIRGKFTHPHAPTRITGLKTKSQSRQGHENLLLAYSRGTAEEWGGVSALFWKSSCPLPKASPGLLVGAGHGDPLHLQMVGLDRAESTVSHRKTPTQGWEPESSQCWCLVASHVQGSALSTQHATTPAVHGSHVFPGRLGADGSLQY